MNVSFNVPEASAAATVQELLIKLTDEEKKAVAREVLLDIFRVPVGKQHEAFADQLIQRYRASDHVFDNYSYSSSRMKASTMTDVEIRATSDYQKAMETFIPWQLKQMAEVAKVIQDDTRKMVEEWKASPEGVAVFQAVLTTFKENYPKAVMEAMTRQFSNALGGALLSSNSYEEVKDLRQSVEDLKRQLSMSR